MVEILIYDLMGSPSNTTTLYGQSSVESTVFARSRYIMQLEKSFGGYAAKDRNACTKKKAGAFKQSPWALTDLVKFCRFEAIPLKMIAANELTLVISVSVFKPAVVAADPPVSLWNCSRARLAESRRCA